MPGSAAETSANGKPGRTLVELPSLWVPMKLMTQVVGLFAYSTANLIIKVNCVNIVKITVAPLNYLKKF